MGENKKTQSFVINIKKQNNNNEVKLETNNDNGYLKYDNNLFYDQTSEFDRFLIHEWQYAMKKGLFKFKIESEQPYRYLPGKYSFVVQLNEKRVTQKRPTDIKNREQIVQPFDADKFNFTKINKNEILFELVNKSETCIEVKQTSEIEENDEASDYVLINICPIDVGHILFAPQLYSRLNQCLTVEAIRLAINFLLISGTASFLVGFNSINAYASVNHLHLHGYYLNTSPPEGKKYPFSVQNIQCAKQVSKHLWYLDEEDYFLPGYVLQLCDFGNNLNEFCEKIFLIVNYLSQNNIPHNIVFLKCDSLSERNARSTPIATIRAFVWPKIPEYDCGPNDLFYGFAVCELAGHFIISNETVYNKITEADVLQLSKNIQVDTETLSRIRKDVDELFCRFN